MSVKTTIRIGAIAAGVVLVGVLGFRLHGEIPGLDSPVYPLAQVEAGLRQHPAVWVGKAVRVRARLSVLAAPCAMMLGGCGLAPARYYALDAGVAGSIRAPRDTVPPLVLDVGAEDPFYAGLQHIPVLGDLAPRPPRVQAVGVMLVRLEPSSSRLACGVNLCYHAVLLGPPPNEGSP
jgi:hypothetical protein